MAYKPSTSKLYMAQVETPPPHQKEEEVTKSQSNMGISDKHSVGLPLANSGMQNQSENKKGDPHSFQSYKEIIQES